MVRYALVMGWDKAEQKRYLLTAPDGETVDEWWRAISEVNGSLQRLSPDMYSFHYGIPEKIPKFLASKLFVTDLSTAKNANSIVFQQQERTDRRSGRIYFIRSKSQPDLFWHTTGGDIHASRTSRTRFLIMRTDAERDVGDVMLDTDVVSITAVVGHGYRPVRKRLEGWLILGDMNPPIPLNETPILLGDLKDGFIAWHLDMHTQQRIRSVERCGEEWELIE